MFDAIHVKEKSDEFADLEAFAKGMDLENVEVDDETEKLFEKMVASNFQDSKSVRNFRNSRILRMFESDEKFSSSPVVAVSNSRTVFTFWT